MKITQVSTETYRWPRPKPTEFTFDSHQYFASRNEGIEAGEKTNGTTSTIDFQITGHGGGDWTIQHQSGRPTVARVGLSGNGGLIRLRSDTFQQLVRGKTHADDFPREKIVFEGKPEDRENVPSESKIRW